MPIIASAKAGGDFKPCPAGVHDAVCAFVEDIGHEHSDLYNKFIHKVVIGWEVNEPMSDGRPYTISKRYTVSLSDKALLRKDLEGWRGQKFTDEQLKGFDLEVLRGKQCQLQIIHNEKGGKTYANIQTVLPKGKHSPAIAVVATEIPEWIGEVRAANEAAYAKVESAPVVILDGPILPSGGAGAEEVPFARTLIADLAG
jgi:hypothetical protein